ncbi:unnamed protein product, partial [Rotaria sp. Silwood2]
SMKIDPIDLRLLFYNDELCENFKKMIKILNIYKYNYCSFNNLDEMIKFHKIFENILQLRCNIDDLEHICFLLYRFQSLSIINIYISSSHNNEYVLSFIKKLSFKLHFNFLAKPAYLNTLELSIWIR